MANNMSQALYKEKREKAAASKDKHIEKLIEIVYLARVYKSLIDSVGWKTLLNDYLEEEMDPNKFIDMIYLPEGTIKEAAIKMQALWEMMAHVTQKIKDGERAIQELNKLKVRDTEY